MQKSHYLRRVWDTSQVQPGWPWDFWLPSTVSQHPRQVGLALTKSALVVTWWTRNFEWWTWWYLWMICNENFLGCPIGSEWCMMTCDLYMMLHSGFQSFMMVCDGWFLIGGRVIWNDIQYSLCDCRISDFTWFPSRIRIIWYWFVVGCQELSWFTGSAIAVIYVQWVLPKNKLQFHQPSSEQPPSYRIQPVHFQRTKPVPRSCLQMLESDDGGCMLHSLS